MSATIEVPESVTVRSAAAFASDLVAAAESRSDVTIDVSGLVECDLSFVQLVLALRAQLKNDGATLSLAQPAGPALCALLDHAGFGEPDPDDAQFWFHGERAQ